jgi:hypothetical protein
MNWSSVVRNEAPGIGPAINPEDARRFRQSILSVLSKINVEECSSQFKEDLKVVYELLSILDGDELHYQQKGSELNRDVSFK